MTTDERYFGKGPLVVLNACETNPSGIAFPQEFDWWQGGSHAGVSYSAVPAQHFSSRTLWDRNITLWAGWVIESGGQRIVYTGDSG